MTTAETIAELHARQLEALSTFVTAMRLTFQSPKGKPVTRQQFIAAIQSTVELLSAVEAAHDPGESIERLAELAMALTDLDFGTVHPSLTITPRRGRKGDLTETWLKRAKACIGIAYWQRAGMTQAAAIKAATRQVPGLKSLLRPRTDLSTSLPSWVTELTRKPRKPVANEQAAEALRDGMKLMEAGHWSGDDLRRIGLALLRSAAR